MADQRAGDVKTRECATCGGQGCEEGCGRCEMAYAGPESHRVCRACGGSGLMTETNGRDA